MNHIPCRERVYSLKLAAEFIHFYRRYAHWLRELLERLGQDAALDVWQSAFQDGEDALLGEILSAGWLSTKDDFVDIATEKDRVLAEFFSSPAEGLTGEQAKRLLDEARPFRHIEQSLLSINVERETTSYETIHLFWNGIARLVEALIARHGKEGELIAYNIMMRWFRLNERPGMEAAEFLSIFSTQPNEPSMHTVSLDYDLVCASDQEVVIHIQECEWARYFRQRNPEIGYLLICSMDEISYRAVHPSIRLQRTSTLMEGGRLCNFRIYSVNPIKV
jgi:hypothetical protein